MTTVFVYGTLKKGFALHDHLQRSKEVEFIGEGWLENADLLNIAWFPGVVDGTRRVFGELYLVPDETLRVLDLVEGSPFLFKRETRDIKLTAFPQEQETPMPEGMSMKAEVYYFQRDTGMSRVIEDGVWRNA